MSYNVLQYFKSVVYRVVICPDKNTLSKVRTTYTLSIILPLLISIITPLICYIPATIYIAIASTAVFTPLTTYIYIVYRHCGHVCPFHIYVRGRKLVPEDIRMIIFHTDSSEVEIFLKNGEHFRYISPHWIFRESSTISNIVKHMEEKGVVIVVA